MLRFAVVFIVVLVGLFTFELMPWGQRWVVIPFTEQIVAISAWLVQLFDDQVFSQGKVLRDIESGFAISIEAGCNGVEATIVLMATMLAFPAPWRMKWIGVGAGFLSVQVLNLLRIITLFYLGQWNQTAFQWAHLYIWQSLMILDVLIVFLIWLRYLPQIIHKYVPEASD